MVMSLNSKNKRLGILVGLLDAIDSVALEANGIYFQPEMINEYDLHWFHYRIY